MRDILSTEAELFGTYLLHQKPTKKVIQLYVKALLADAGNSTPGDERALAFMRKHPWSIGLFDASLAALRPNSEVRRRLYVLFSILESMPQYAQQFLPQDRSFWYVFVVLFAGIKAVGKTIIGSVLVGIVVR